MCIDNFTCLLSSNACTSSNGVKDIGANLTGELTILQQRTFGMCDVATNYATSVQSSCKARQSVCEQCPPSPSSLWNSFELPHPIATLLFGHRSTASGCMGPSFRLYKFPASTYLPCTCLPFIGSHSLLWPCFPSVPKFTFPKVFISVDWKCLILEPACEVQWNQSFSSLC